MPLFPFRRRGLLAISAALFGALAAPAVAQGLSAVRIACERDNAGAEIRINGQYKGDCPIDAEVQAGQIVVEAVKRVDATRERRFVTRFGLGEGVVKRVDVVLGPPQLNAAAQRAEDERRRAEEERRRAEAERKRLFDEAARKAEAERRAREEAEAKRQAEFQRLASLENDRRRREQAQIVLAAFQAAGLSAGTGQGFRDCPDCPELVWIPPGRAPQLSGDSISHRWYNGSEILAPLAVGRFEVSFDEWDACVAQGACQRRPAEGKSEGIIFDSSWGRGRQPVINITWTDAQEYVAWLSGRTGQRYRLLSLLEFGYAARAGSPTRFPWGDRLDAGAANCPGCGGKATDRTRAVGSFAPNAWGLHDMQGNVTEFVADCFGSRSRGSNNVASWERWVSLPERARDGRPIDLCSVAAGRPAVSDPAYGMAGARYDSAPGSEALFAQWIAPSFMSQGAGLRVAREFTPPAPELDLRAMTPYRDCPDCPELVNLPAGRFEMGTPFLFDQGWAENETPLRWVNVPAFAIGRFEVTRAQWAQFQRERAVNFAVASASAPVPVSEPVADCQVPVTESQSVLLRLQPGRDWANPGFPQGDDHPVACVGRPDAEAYVAWLSLRTGQRYRLPTEAEWEYASRAGSSNRRPWRGGGASCGVANLRDVQYRQTFATNDNVDCNDGAAGTAPVGRYQPNPWGLFDMLGNVAEHVADCWGSYAGASTDGSVARSSRCADTVVRGGSWYTQPGALAASHPGRQSALRINPLSTQGLRVVRELGTASGATR
jgi:formylglycine-generating enzyme required for sulfatase activity